MDSAMDLSLRNSAGSSPASLQGISSAVMTPSSLKLPIPTSNPGVNIVRPIPRPPWSIVWYQNLWTISPSSNNQSEPKSESGFEGNNSEEGSKTSIKFRTNERSSFSVLNNLSTNAVNRCVGNNYNYNFPYSSSEEEQQMQHRLSQFSTQKYGILANDTTPSCSSVFKGKPTDHPRNQHNFTISQKPVLGKEYSSDEDDIDSDNSENIVVTTSSSFSTGLERDSMIKSSTCSMDKSEFAEVISASLYPHEDNRPHQTTAILDVACCDGPVQFKRISNPNFALTVEHNEVCPPAAFADNDGKKMAFMGKDTARQHKSAEVKTLNEMYEDEQADQSRTFSLNSADSLEGEKPLHFPHQFHTVEDGELDSNTANATASSAVTTHKSYLCIYCNQSFKSLFCYQKHKKRHLNPVSVDITTTTAANSTSYRSTGGVGTSNKKGGGGGSTGCGDGGGGGGGGTVGIIPENAKAKTKDLNVQFFPCKKCGCKFPSYYFVHKHRKICH